jgi:hypothetical protein
MLCLCCILLVLRWHLSGGFGGVPVVSLLVGVLVVVAWHVSSHMRRYFNGVLHLRALTQHTISNNPARLWPMTSPALFLSVPEEPT